MSKKANKKQTKVDSQKTVTVKSQFDSMLDSMKSNIANMSDRQASAKQAYEESKLAAKTEESRRNLHAYKTKTAFRKSTLAKKSRRAIVIDYLHAAKYTKKEIASLLVSQHDIADIANNLKCVSGTMYDLQTNTTCNFKTDANTSVISCVSANCKYK